MPASCSREPAPDVADAGQFTVIVRRWPLLLALGLGAYLVFVLATLPASLVASRLEARGLTAVSSSGTIWHGRLAGLRSGRTVLGDFEWDLEPAGLFTGKLAAHVELARPDGGARGDIAVGPGGSVRLEHAQVALPLSTLADVGAPAGWTGTLHADLELLVVEDGWIVDAQGTIEARDLVGPARNPAPMGGYRVVLPGGGADAQAAGDKVVGALEDLADGPLAVTGSIELARDRTYEISGLVAPRPSASRAVIDSLRFLGEPDEVGRRPFSIAGSL